MGSDEQLTVRFRYATPSAPNPVFPGFSRYQNVNKEITWEDGRKYEITRVKDKRRAASTRAGGVGERYTCVVDGKEIFLFYEDNNMWFMERAGA